ncbi:protein phosphatase 1 regulatory subunit 15A [Danio aesculapii]|uniref:protein phosphatase 1 regulatory subunit 15A n=1 Tax=Danio aesculapii TaxID=1142201 RepID=UPI0024BFD986|nr:protein phosphatase 1 regulatory subunit 15A [Danio aesculapii]
MAPFTISTPHPSPHQGCLPQKPSFVQSEMSLLSSKRQDLCVIDHLKASVMKMKLHLWQAVNTVQNYCVSVAQLLKSKMIFFICVGRKVAMMGVLKKSGAEALERPETRDEEREMKDPEMDLEEKERESSGIDDLEGKEQESSGNEDEDEAEWESDEEEGEETEDSDWSDDDDDSEASAESLEIWESFLNNGDPYNPLSFCSSVSSRTNTQPIKTQPSADTRLEESQEKTQSKNSGKKVCFSERVCVRPLLVWSFASRSARDGSCWLQMARDRERFRRRVQTLEPVLKPCLMPEHRARVWERLRINTAA